ncbi:MAG: prefoldin subunit alpha [Methanobacteriota archaeon]
MATEEQITKNLTLIEYYKEQLSNLDLQLQYLQAAVVDYQKAKVSIEQLDNTEGKPEILVPVGSGIFIRGAATDTGKVLIDIGASIVAEKTVEDAIKKIDDRIETLQKNQEKLYSMAQQMQQEATELSNKTQDMLAEQRK